MTPASQTPSSLHPAGDYELFISYSRRDNVPQKPGDAKGWVSALCDEILADHRRFSTEPLRIFFDKSEIKDMDDWRHRILGSLRHSRILLVCLSPNYFASGPCRWEFEEYTRRQVHQLMGQDSFAQVYFVEVPGTPEQTAAERWYELLQRSNYTDLRPFFPLGIDALREEAVRLKLADLGASLWDRIKRARRAIAVQGNLRRVNPHFVGRRTELRQLHENLALGAIGVVTAVHGLGGQGKTELATAYAHGWADCYAGGLWVLAAEGKRELLPLLGDLCAELKLPPATSGGTAEARGRSVLAELRRRATSAKVDEARAAACLVILDNVSETALLAEPQLAQLPREDWLRVVATTREGPEKFPASRQKSLAFIAVDALSDEDAARLIEDHQPDGQWPRDTATADLAAARAIAHELGGFTLAVQAVGIYLGLHPDLRPADYLARLRSAGLGSVDELARDADVAAQIQHREKQLALVLEQTLARLTAPERTALEYASLLPPDDILWPWLRALTMQAHPEDFAPRPGFPDPWVGLRRRLEGLRLLTTAHDIERAHLHRLTGACMYQSMPAAQLEKRLWALHGLLRYLMRGEVGRFDFEGLIEMNFPSHTWDDQIVATMVSGIFSGMKTGDFAAESGVEKELWLCDIALVEGDLDARPQEIDIRELVLPRRRKQDMRNPNSVALGLEAYTHLARMFRMFGLQSFTTNRFGFRTVDDVFGSLVEFLQRHPEAKSWKNFSTWVARTEAIAQDTRDRASCDWATRVRACVESLGK